MGIITSRSFKLVVLCVALAGVAVLALLFSAPAPAHDKTPPRSDDNVKAQWAPASVNETIQPGQTRTIPVTLTVDKNLPDTLVQVSPEIAPYVTVSPTTIGKTRKGTTVSLTLTMSVPIDAFPATTTGMIELQRAARQNPRDESKNAADDDSDSDSDRKGNEEREKKIGKPLPVSLNVVWAQTDNLLGGIVFSYPTFGRTATLTTIPTDTGSTIVDIAFAAPNNPPSSQYRLAFIGNPGHLSLIEWFRHNVDLNGTIADSGGYELQTLINGLEVLLVTGPVPEDYGPLADVYAMSPSKTTAIVLATGQTNQFDLIGIDSSARKHAYLFMLQTLNLQ